MSGKWSRDECIVVLDLYLNEEDYTQDESDETVREIAETIGRSPGAVVMRLANYRSVDPNNTRGLTNISEVAKSVWEDYSDEPEKLHWEAERAKDRISGDGVVDEDEGGSKKKAGGTTERKVRPNQREFRAAVLERYGENCALCDVDHTGLLVSAHILPWSQHEEERTDPENGVVLCETHHRAFDLGFFTISPDMEIAVDPSFTTQSDFLAETVVDREGEELEFQNPPSREYLSQWNERYEWVSTE